MSRMVMMWSFFLVLENFHCEERWKRLEELMDLMVWNCLGLLLMMVWNICKKEKALQWKRRSTSNLELDVQVCVLSNHLIEVKLFLSMSSCSFFERLLWFEK